MDYAKADAGRNGGLIDVADGDTWPDLRDRLLPEMGVGKHDRNDDNDADHGEWGIDVCKPGVGSSHEADKKSICVVGRARSRRVA